MFTLPHRGRRAAGSARAPGGNKGAEHDVNKPKVAVQWAIELAPSTDDIISSEGSYMDKLGTETVDIFVGPEKRLFRVHKEPLCDNIPKFKLMFEGKFKEAGEGVADLPETNADDFGALLDMAVYHGGNVKSLGKAQEMAFDPVGLYVLVDECVVPRMKDKIMDCIILRHQICKELPSIQFVRDAYTKAPSGSLLREYALLAMKFVYCNKAKADGYEINWPSQALATLQDEIEDFHKDYTAISRQDPADPRYLLDVCRFHLHEEGVKCGEHHKEIQKQKRRRRQKTHKEAMEENENPTHVSPPPSPTGATADGPTSGGPGEWANGGGGC